MDRNTIDNATIEAKAKNEAEAKIGADTPPEAEAEVASSPDSNAQANPAPSSCGGGHGKPNYNRTVVAIWAVLLMVFACVMMMNARRKQQQMSEVENLVYQASQLFDRQLFEESTELLRRAAERGYAPAQTYYGGSLKMGIGTAQDLEQAVQWYRKAAAQNYPVAFFELAVCYQHGFGVERDLDEAEKWYRKAYDGGIRDESQKALDELAATREREAASPRY